MKKVLILVNHDVVIYNFRKELVEELIKKDYKVYISSPYGKNIDLLINMGCEYIETDIERHGMNVINDLKLINKYKKMIKQINPSLVLSYTIKPNIYGGIACSSLDIPYISTITGLGTALEKDNLTQKMLIYLYRFAFRKISNLFFQNKDNMYFFKKNKIATNSHKLVPGSGVNLEEFPIKKYPEEKEKIKILFIGRVMEEKGIGELSEAAKILKKNGKQIDFHDVGFYEDDYIDQAKEIEKLNVITFHGQKDNVKKYIKNCHAVILPSYHEGMANVLLEAASMGRPILASSIPGCQETFDEGITGIGFKPKDAGSIVKAINKFISLPYVEKEKMGIKGRKKIEEEFDRKKVVSTYMQEIENCLASNDK